MSRAGGKPKSVIIDWLGFSTKGWVQQTVVKLRRGETVEEALALFASDPNVARVLSWRNW